MAWEEPLMEAHAHAICSRGGDILNVGFGLGLIDKVMLFGLSFVNDNPCRNVR